MLDSNQCLHVLLLGTVRWLDLSLPCMFALSTVAISTYRGGFYCEKVFRLIYESLRMFDDSGYRALKHPFFHFIVQRFQSIAISYLFSFNPRKLSAILVKLVTVMMCSGFQLTGRAKKRRLTLVAFLGFFTLAFYLHSRRNKDNASHITRIKSSAGTLSNILRLLQYFSLWGIYTNSRILSFFLPVCHACFSCSVLHLHSECVVGF